MNSQEFNLLQSFTRQLAKSGMRQADIAARGYEYALLLYQAKEEPRFPRGTELPTLLKIHIMDHAADALKDVLQYGIERESVYPLASNPVKIEDNTGHF